MSERRQRGAALRPEQRRPAAGPMLAAASIVRPARKDAERVGANLRGLGKVLPSDNEVGKQVGAGARKDVADLKDVADDRLS